MSIIVNLENHNDKFSVCTGLDIFCVRYFFSTNTAMSGCKPSTCRSIVFLKFWICRTASDSIWVSMLTSACCFFPLSTLNKSIEFYGYIEICWEILQYLWPDLGRSIMTPKLFPSNGGMSHCPKALSPQATAVPSFCRGTV